MEQRKLIRYQSSPLIEDWAVIRYQSGPKSQQSVVLIALCKFDSKTNIMSSIVLDCYASTASLSLSLSVPLSVTMEQRKLQWSRESYNGTEEVTMEQRKLQWNRESYNVIEQVAELVGEANSR